ncbi:MAG: (2Fe-2S)-binding protein [Deltaproteobacteria bacterium]|nr:(2Fe-2S)-binding protein [Deltaproteobacteria bacterium]
MTKIIIDGRTVKARRGATVLEAARAAGITTIPTLCHNDALAPYGSCRLCIVEIANNGRTTIESSCTYPVTEGMSVKTNSPRVIEGRKLVIELFLARCPNVKKVQELAREYGVQDSAVEWGKENEYCILCGLCVRACNEVIKAGAIQFAGRGKNKVVDSPFHLPAEDCLACGSCAFVCPTGIIKLQDRTATAVCTPEGTREKGPAREITNWQIEYPLKTCAACGNPIAPLPMLKKIAEEHCYQMDFFNLCPSCRTYPAVDTDLCTACNACIVVCPAGAAQFVEDGQDQKSHIFTQNCCGCHSCMDVCGWGAIKAPSKCS